MVGTLGKVTAIAHTDVMKQRSAIVGNFDAEQFSPIFWPMIGELASSSKAAICVTRVGTQGGQRKLADSREIAGGIVFTHAASILANGTAQTRETETQKTACEGITNEGGGLVKQVAQC